MWVPHPHLLLVRLGIFVASNNFATTNHSSFWASNKVMRKAPQIALLIFTSVCVASHAQTEEATALQSAFSRLNSSSFNEGWDAAKYLSQHVDQAFGRL